MARKKKTEESKIYEPTLHDRMSYQSIYTINNRYGYNIRVNHPEIIGLYNDFKKRIGVPEHMPLSDQERITFETEVLSGKYGVRLKRA